jgi:hypothetical protein
MWEIGLSQWWYFETDCRWIQVIGEGAGYRKLSTEFSWEIFNAEELWKGEREREKILQGNKWWWPANNLTIENNFGGSVMVGNLLPRQGSMGKSSSTYPSSVCGHATVFLTSKIPPIGNEKHRTIATALAVCMWPKREINHRPTKVKTTSDLMKSINHILLQHNR